MFFQKILKKNGIIFIKLPVHCWVRKCFGFLDKDKTHISILKESEIFQALKVNKFKILDCWRNLPFTDEFQSRNILKYIGFDSSIVAKKL